MFDLPWELSSHLALQRVEAYSSSIQGFAGARAKKGASYSTSNARLRSEMDCLCDDKDCSISFKREQMRLNRHPCPSVGKAFSHGKELVHQANDQRICLTSLRRDIEGLVSTMIQGQTTISGRIAPFAHMLRIVRSLDRLPTATRRGR